MPTITTDDPHEYREQMELITAYAEGVHVDFADGEFAPSKLLPIANGWRSDQLITHVHIMYKDPLKELRNIIKLSADLVILHAESENLTECLETLQENGNRTGVAILPETSVDVLAQISSLFDHVLVFGGHIGYQGGKEDLALLDKVKAIKQKYPDVEISWDGGVNGDNTRQISEAGVDILNVGGYLKKSKNAKKTYEELQSLVS